jgi:two-component sensor histidine kinase
MSVAFWCLAVCMVVMGVLLARQWSIAARMRRRVAVLEGGERIRDEELRHLAATRLPALVEFIYDRPVEVPGPLHSRLAGTAYDESLQMTLNLFAESVEQAKTRADHSAKATLKAAMRSVQSLANEQQLAISNMQERHDDPYVLEDLLKIDHMNAQLGRRAQATAVLCGSWPGQQRSASALTDVVRGATSRIRDYLRVQVNSVRLQADVAVVSRVVEPVVLAVAELLDNAARHSQPNSSVQVDFQRSHNGIAILVDDAGVGMTPEELERASRLLSGREAMDINRLGDPPQVGFGVVGVLAARYGFSVSVDTHSPYGGVRAVVFLPTALLTAVEDLALTQPVRTAPAMAASRQMAEAAETSPAAEAPRTAETTATKAPGGARPVTASGLPKRQRASGRGRSRPSLREPESTGRPESPGQVEGAGRPESTGQAGGADRPESAKNKEGTEHIERTGRQERSAPPDGPEGRSARDIAASMGAWQRGTRSGRATAAPDSEGNPQA